MEVIESTITEKIEAGWVTAAKKVAKEFKKIKPKGKKGKKMKNSTATTEAAIANAVAMSDAALSEQDMNAIDATVTKAPKVAKAPKAKVAKSEVVEGDVLSGKPERRLATFKRTAEYVMAFAKANYERGFDAIVECLSIEDIMRELVAAKSTSKAAALKYYRDSVKLRIGQEAEAW